MECNDRIIIVSDPFRRCKGRNKDEYELNSFLVVPEVNEIAIFTETFINDHNEY